MKFTLKVIRNNTEGTLDITFPDLDLYNYNDFGLKLLFENEEISIEETIELLKNSNNYFAEDVIQKLNNFYLPPQSKKLLSSNGKNETTIKINHIREVQELFEFSEDLEEEGSLLFYGNLVLAAKILSQHYHFGHKDANYCNAKLLELQKISNEVIRKLPDMEMMLGDIDFEDFYGEKAPEGFDDDDEDFENDDEDFENDDEDFEDDDEDFEDDDDENEKITEHHLKKSKVVNDDCDVEGEE